MKHLLSTLFGMGGDAQQEPTPAKSTQCRHGLIDVALLQCDACYTIIFTSSGNPEKDAFLLRKALQNLEEQAARILAPAEPATDFHGGGAMQASPEGLGPADPPAGHGERSEG